MSEIEKAVEVLKKGGVVAYPTDTAYGFAVDATSTKAIKRLMELKGRGSGKGISVIFPSLAQAKKVVSLNSHAKRLMDAHWPGGLTLVLPVKAKGSHWKLLCGGTRCLAIRRPDSEISMQLAEKLGKPITATSANLSGKPTTFSVPEIKRQFAKSRRKPDFYLDGGKLPGKRVSTVVQVEGRHVTLLREGAIDFHEIIKQLK